MHKKQDLFQGTRILVIAASLVIIIWGIHRAQSVLVSCLVAAFLAVIVIQPVRWLEGRRIPSVAAVLIVVAGVGAALSTIGFLVSISLHGFAADLPVYQRHLKEQLSVLQAYLAASNIQISEPFLFEHLNPGKVMNLTVDTIAAVGRALCGIAMIMLILTFILLEASSFPIKIRSILGNPREDFLSFTRFIHDINRYMVIKTEISLAAGILLGLWLYILGVDYPILWGFLTFLLHFIPNVGSLIASVPPVLLALVQRGEGHALLAAAGFAFVNFTLGNVVEPKLMGRKLGLSTLAVFLSLIFWEQLLGPIGLVLSVPITMAIKFCCESSERTRWIAILLGPEPVAPRTQPATAVEPSPVVVSPEEIGMRMNLEALPKDGVV